MAKRKQPITVPTRKKKSAGTKKNAAAERAHLRTLSEQELRDCEAFRLRLNAMNAGLSQYHPHYLSDSKFARISAERGGTGKERHRQTWSDLAAGRRRLNDHAKLVAAIAFNDRPQGVCSWLFPELTPLRPEIGRQFLSLHPRIQHELEQLLDRLVHAPAKVRARILAATHTILADEVARARTTLSVTPGTK